MRVLISGGSGSFGKAFTRFLLEQGLAERICIYSRGEHAQAAMREQMDSDRLRFMIGDVRDRYRLKRAMEGCDVVVHSAALKRVTTCEYDVGEVVRTNVEGAMNVIEASKDAGVAKVVALSTDKAAQPINAYGASKLLMEKAFLAANNSRGATGPIYSCTRYGNVAGSAGSVIPTWREAKKQGRRVRVTDPECTRFWMRMDEAVALVYRTIQTMKGGELNIPTLPAYRLGDLAEAMGVQYDIVGLDSHEKVHETMDGITTSADARRMSVEELRAGLEALHG